MKKFTFLFILSFFVGDICAQAVQYDTVTTEIVVDYFETVGHNLVSNTTQSPQTYEWARNVVTIEPEWRTQICDKNQCYFFHVDTQRFELLVDSSGILDVHVQTNNVYMGYALIELQLTNLGNPAETYPLVYIFDSGVSGTRQLDISDFKVFPNPSKGMFHINNDNDNIKTIEIHSASGMLMKRVDVRDRTLMDIVDLPKGSYILNLIGHDEKPLGTKLISKL